MWHAMMVALVVFGMWSVPLASAAPVAVRVPESAVQSYLVLRDEARKAMPLGEYKQRPKAGAIEVQLSFKFKDGSCIRKRPSSRSVGCSSSRVTSCISADRHFPPRSMRRWTRVTADTSSGTASPGRTTMPTRGSSSWPDTYPSVMQITIVKHMARDASETIYTVAFTPKPRILKLVIQRPGHERTLATSTPRLRTLL
jgi:hypothetical protein